MQQEIDLFNEQAIALRDVPKHLPKRNGKRVHFQTIFRWASKGCRGVVLATVKVGGIRYTSLEALRRFYSVYSPTTVVGGYQDAVEEELKRQW